MSVFEVVINTLEVKLQRIDSLDRTVESLMQRVQSLDDKVSDNIEKTNNVIVQLQSLDNKLTEGHMAAMTQNLHNNNNGRGSRVHQASATYQVAPVNLDSRLVSLDQKVSDIDSKLSGLKNQIDNNFLTADDFNAEASERKPVSMNVAEITKTLNSEIIQQFNKELDGLKLMTNNIDKKLQFHINVVSENLGKALRLVNEVHEAVVDPEHAASVYNISTSTTPSPAIQATSKIDALAQQIKPIMSVSNKMDEVWNVVVGTKSSVDHLVPKSDELLTQTQRQERAIGQIHQDLRQKTNQIIENLDLVEKRLKKQEDDVAVLSQRPVPSELLLDPTIDRLVEYDSNR